MYVNRLNLPMKTEYLGVGPETLSVQRNGLMCTLNVCYIT